MTKEPLNIKQILEEFDKKFTGVENIGNSNIQYIRTNRPGDIRQFIETSLREAMEAVKPPIFRASEVTGTRESTEGFLFYERLLNQNITNFFKE